MLPDKSRAADALHSAKNKIGLKQRLNQLFASDFIRKVVATFAARIVIIVLGLITSVIVTRILGPEGRGLYAIAITMGAVGVQVANLGLHASNTFYVARDRTDLPSLIGNSIVVSMAIGGFGSLITWLVFLMRPDWAPVSGILLILALINIPLGLIYLLAVNLLIGIQDIKSYNFIEIICKIVSVLAIGVIIAIKWVTVESLFVAGMLTTSLGIIWSVTKLIRHASHFPTPSLSIFTKSLKYGFKAYLAAFFSYMVLKVDLFMVQSFLDNTQTGYYSIAVTVADMVYMLPVIIGTILFPKLTAMKDNQEKWLLTKKSAYSVAIIMLILCLSAYILSDYLIVILFGTEFLPASPAFKWLLPAIFILSVNTIFMNYFSSLGMPRFAIYSPALASALNIFLNISFIPKYGIIGASLSSIIAYGMMLLFSLAYQFKTHEYHYK